MINAYPQPDFPFYSIAKHEVMPAGYYTQVHTEKCELDLATAGLVGTHDISIDIPEELAAAYGRLFKKVKDMRPNEDWVFCFRNRGGVDMVPKVIHFEVGIWLDGVWVPKHYMDEKPNVLPGTKVPNALEMPVERKLCILCKQLRCRHQQ